MYDTVLFLHVVGVIVWLGGALALTVFHLRLAGETSGIAQRSFSIASAFYGRRVLGPAVGLTLVSGIAMVGLTGWIMPFWVAWGLAGLLLSWFLGAVLVSRTAQSLAKLASSGSTDTEPERVTMLRRRLTALSVVDLAVLLSVVWAMVFKPVL